MPLPEPLLKPLQQHEQGDLSLGSEIMVQQARNRPPKPRTRLYREAYHLAGLHADVATTTAASFLTVTRFITQVELRSSLGGSDVALRLTRSNAPSM